jgi:hypothetical protein
MKVFGLRKPFIAQFGSPSPEGTRVVNFGNWAIKFAAVEMLLITGYSLTFWHCSRTDWQIVYHTNNRVTTTY